MRKTILALLIAAFGVAQADCCCMPDCCGTFEVIGEALYLRPSTCDLNYVIVDDRSESSGLSQGTERGACPNYDWGFRIGVGYVMDCTCYDARITYTRLDSSDRSAIESTDSLIWITCAHPNMAESPILGTVDDPARAHQRFKTEYNAVDLEVGSRGMKGCDFWFRAHAGLHYANICTTRDVHYEGIVFVDFFDLGIYDVRGHNKVWGIGPRFGVEMRYDIACGFGIGGSAGLGILAGETRSKMHELVVLEEAMSPFDTIETTLDVCQRSRCLVVPEIDARLGVNYLFCCGDCFSLLAEVGYEWHSYIGALDHTVFNDVAGTSSAQCENYNLDGLYISFRLQI